MKICSACRQELPLESFYKDCTQPDGRQYTCKTCRATQVKAWKEAKPGLYKATLRRSQLKLKYGITQEQFDSLLKKQGFACAICGANNPSHSSGQWCVDHDHKTGAVRGLLCAHCNLGLGHLQDSISVLFKAIKYLESNHDKYCKSLSNGGVQEKEMDPSCR